ncbi:type II secretion system GspH family protein [Patescibacteria group bacterium]|nr:type II secretion system GspH family protein [Patescibacteria group bacterium]
MVVIAIIGILASVVLASLNTARKKSRDARRIADLKQIQLALELYFDAASAGETSYPDTVAAAAAAGFIPTEPKDPATGASYAYDNLDASTGGACVIADAGTCLSYHLGANLEESTNSALSGDVDACVAVAGACTKALPGTTLDGGDDDNCAGAAGTYCYDLTP